MRQVTIEIADEVAAWLDKKSVELAVLRTSNRGDKCFALGDAEPWVRDSAGGYINLVLRNKFTQPDFLQPGWIVTNCGKIWFHCKDEPQQRPDGKYSITGMMIDQTMLRWTPPTVTGPTKYEIK